MIIPYNTCSLSNEDWFKGKPQANLKTYKGRRQASNTLEQMLHQSKKNIYPHQQHTVKKNTFLYPQYRTKLPPKPKTLRSIRSIQVNFVVRHPTSTNHQSIRPKPTPEATKKKGKIIGPLTRCEFRRPKERNFSQNPRTILGRNALEDPPGGIKRSQQPIARESRW